MASRTTYQASVSFEYDYQPVQTVRAEIQMGSPEKAASRAVRVAREAFPLARPRSIVVVLEVGERVELPKRAQPPALKASLNQRATEFAAGG